jgi:drug/metabolite transporter (DMT)-like permease
VKPARLFLLTLLAMIAFAGNSLLCRLALKHTAIDPASFTFVRLASGALVLWLISRARQLSLGNAGSWPSALALFVYAAAFSFAYVSLSAGTGALLLFAAVQATMILWGIRQGERLRPLQVVGVAGALIGLMVLVLPGISAPPLRGSLLMLSAGAGWGVYSLRGQSASDATRATTGNFIRAVPFAIVLSLVLWPHLKLDRVGIGYAIASGGLASGCGYVMWYRVLPALKAATAATVQLSVPVLAALGGILLLGEPLSLRFVAASVTVLGGIALVVLEKSRTTRP